MRVLFVLRLQAVDETIKTYMMESKHEMKEIFKTFNRL